MGERIGAILVISVLAAAGLASCGGGDDDEPLTKSEFMKRATFVCNKGEQEREETLQKAIQTFEEGEAQITPKLQELAILKVLANYETMIDRLAELNPPEGEEKQVEKIIKAMEQGAARIKKDPTTAVNGAVALDAANVLLKKQGLENCRI